MALNEKIAPYKVQIIPKIENDKKKEEAFELYEKLSGKAILDDRENVSLGAKIKDCKIFGTPYMAILGDKVEDGFVELENIKTGEKKVVSQNELLKMF